MPRRRRFKSKRRVAKPRARPPIYDAPGRPPLNLAGQHFGRLTAVQDIGRKITAGGHVVGRVWLCQCDCGGTTQAVATRLRSNARISCGCARYRHVTA